MNIAHHKRKRATADPHVTGATAGLSIAMLFSFDKKPKTEPDGGEG